MKDRIIAVLFAVVLGFALMGGPTRPAAVNAQTYIQKPNYELDELKKIRKLLIKIEKNTR